MRRSKGRPQHSEEDIRSFFANSGFLDTFVTRPLSHIAPHWELMWDEEGQQYEPEPYSFAADVNAVVELLAKMPRPQNYHDHEDELARRLVRRIGRSIQKKHGRWVGEDYRIILQDGALDDYDQEELLASACGRVHAALDYGQQHIDEMEEGHLNMLATVLTLTLYHRVSHLTTLMVSDD